MLAAFQLMLGLVVFVVVVGFVWFWGFLFFGSVWISLAVGIVIALFLISLAGAFGNGIRDLFKG